MSSKTIKKIEILRNKTRKNRENILKKVPTLTDEQKELICKTVPSTFESFEGKIDKVFKENKIDVTSTSFNLEKEIIKEIKQAVSPSNITPNNDFYSYVNERWLKNLDIEAYQQYITQVDDFRLIQDKVYRELIEIINNYLKDPATKNTPKGKCIKNAYKSFKKFNTSEQIRCLANVIVEYIDELREVKTNIWKKIANSNMNEIISWGAPFVWSINPDDKNPTKYKCYLEPPELTLLDLDIYYDYPEDTEDDKKYKKKCRHRYFQYLNELFVIAFGGNHHFNVKDVYDTEIELLNAMSCDLIKQEDEDGYNLVTKDEAIKGFGFDWEEFCKALGFKEVPSEFVTSNVNYLLCGTKLLLEKWDSDQWRTYWIYLYIRQQCRFSEYGWKNHFEFYGKFLRGQEGIVDNYILPIFGMSFTFNTFLTNEYILRYKNDQSIQYVKNMVEDLRRVFVRIIKRNNWLQPKTKRIAIEKLETIKLLVGSPPILRDDPLLNYKPDDPWGNLVKMAQWRHEQAISLVGKNIIDIPVIDWSQIPPKMVSTQAYVVNAMYTPTENSIYIPLGYIQKPFVDLDERGLEYNLAHIGFTIAHELSHSLDDLGSRYDKDGKLNSWWTKKDAEHFKKIQKDIVKQYEDYAKRDGIHFDAWPSIGEDLADISGFAICLEYLRDFQLKNKDILPIQTLSFEGFFIYFALQSRQKISKKAILAQLKTNPHPLDKYRCNIPLSRSNVFRAIYKVKKGDNMWWHSSNSVWEN
jgi:endothelin-converting enzyme/putative endopeptidase